MSEELYTIRDLVRVGVSKITLYKWQEMGLISPTFKAGKVNLYNQDTIKRVKKIKQLRNTYTLGYIKSHPELLGKHKD